MIPAQLQRRDLFFIQIPRGEKGPCGAEAVGWNRVETGLQYDDPGLQAHLSRGGNYGYYPSPDSHILNIDVDHAALYQQAGGEALTRETFQYTAHPDRHKYRAVVEVEDLPTHWRGRVSRIDSPNGERVLELFFPAGPITTSTRDPETGEIDEKTIIKTGGQVVGPGSLHPNGWRYEITNDSPIRGVKWGDIIPVIEAINPDQDIQTAPAPKIYREHTAAGPNTRLLRERYNLEVPYPVNPRPAGNEIRGSHPFHGSTTGSNYLMNPYRGVACCYRHKVGPDDKPVGYDAAGWRAIEYGIIQCGDPFDREAFLKLVEKLEWQYPEVAYREKLAYRERKRREQAGGTP